LNKQQDQQKIGIQYIYMLLPELVSADLICGNKKELLNNDISAIQHSILLYTFVHKCYQDYGHLKSIDNT